MSLYHILPMFAAAAFLLAGPMVIAGADSAPMQRAWLVPAVLSAAFFAWSVHAVASEGLLGFWPEHVRNAWGNQIWFDLLLGVGTAFALLAPRAKAQGMRLVPWFVAIACTGNVGLLAMCARYLFLCEKSRHDRA